MKASTISSHPFLQKTLCLVLLACLIAGCVAIGGGNQTAFAETAELSPADLYEQNVNSTVGITISGETSSRYGYGYTYQASGSGFIITSDGYILTNYHVISGSKAVTVATYDHNTYDAKVIGYDASNDIAVIKIDAENLKPVTLGDSDTLRVGENVYAIGNPLGELTFSLTGGIVSALSRNVQTEAGTSMSLIQTDCAINSGNSGGALFNTRGEVIGITNAKYSSSGMGSEAEIDNIGFAIPINSVKRSPTSASPCLRCLKRPLKSSASRPVRWCRMSRRTPPPTRPDSRTTTSLSRSAIPTSMTPMIWFRSSPSLIRATC